jgi:uncharacterized MnhB-related membrane protein
MRYSSKYTMFYIIIFISIYCIVQYVFKNELIDNNIEFSLYFLGVTLIFYMFACCCKYIYKGHFEWL